MQTHRAPRRTKRVRGQPVGTVAQRSLNGRSTVGQRLVNGWSTVAEQGEAPRSHAAPAVDAHVDALPSTNAARQAAGQSLGIEPAAPASSGTIAPRGLARIREAGQSRPTHWRTRATFRQRVRQRNATTQGLNGSEGAPQDNRLLNTGYGAIEPYPACGISHASAVQRGWRGSYSEMPSGGSRPARSNLPTRS